MDCPCKRTQCERHGDCSACRVHHNNMKRKMRVACDRINVKKYSKKAQVALDDKTS